MPGSGESIAGQGSGLAAEGLLFREIRDFARLNFNCVLFSFAPRACNSLAHALAAYGARQTVDREFWPENIPDDVNVRQACLLAGPV